MLELSDWLMAVVNRAFVGRSFLIDTLVALPLRNELIKAVPVLACFIAAWHAGAVRERLCRRQTLLVTLMAAVLATGLSRLVSASNALPRPYAFQQQVYRLESSGVVPQHVRDLRVPRDNASQLRAERLAEADIPPNDFGSFPSDHAALYFTIASGIFLASRFAGSLAIAWTAAAILLPRVWTGMHSPLDILGGCLLGAAALAAGMSIQRTRFSGFLRRTTHWTLRHEGTASALLFVFLFEAGVTFDHGVELVRGIARHLPH
ncbi:MAG: phosphatase PAP2 family protein [Pirellulales bacterium]|nr:phosphatase PAP2 family protein [Pirellulales bacterium]